MAFDDQLYRQKKTSHPEIVMKAKSFLSKTLLEVTPSMHKVRRLSLLAAIESMGSESLIFACC